jgi:hypothetical protein
MVRPVRAMVGVVKIPKQQVMALLQDQERMGKHTDAEEELPEEVDTQSDHDRDILQRIGVDPAELEDKFSGGKHF